MKTRKVDVIKPCDFCKKVKDRYYDAPTISGAWANMCPECKEQHGNKSLNIGTEFVLRDMKLPSASETLDGIELCSLEQVVMDGDREIQCPNCQESRAVEPDASYTYECEGCDTKVRVPCLM